MPATLTKESGRTYLTWCSTCSDGVRGSKRQATEWADEHNQSQH